MKNLIIAFLVTFSTLSAQNIDYNLKKGYMAKGYDVVAYFSNEAIKGDNKIMTSYDGVKYKFSSKENLATFNKNPEKYIPQYGGYCAYAVALKNDKVSINPKAFQIINGKLYLFYDAWGTNTLDLWEKEGASILKEKADKNWQNIKFKK